MAIANIMKLAQSLDDLELQVEIERLQSLGLDEESQLVLLVLHNEKAERDWRMEHVLRQAASDAGG